MMIFLVTSVISLHVGVLSTERWQNISSYSLATGNGTEQRWRLFTHTLIKIVVINIVLLRLSFRCCNLDSVIVILARRQ